MFDSVLSSGTLQERRLGTGAIISIVTHGLIAGFVLVHMVFAGLSFVQLWLVRERGFDAAGIARQIGGLQIAFGVLGSLVGGVLSDRLAHRLKGGHAGFMVLLILVPVGVATKLLKVNLFSVK